MVSPAEPTSFSCHFYQKGNLAHWCGERQKSQNSCILICRFRRPITQDFRNKVTPCKQLNDSLLHIKRKQPGFVSNIVTNIQPRYPFPEPWFSQIFTGSYMWDKEKIHCSLMTVKTTWHTELLSSPSSSLISHGRRADCVNSALHMKLSIMFSRVGFFRGGRSQ